jgi:mono/diheme cytochrome c family protein
MRCNVMLACVFLFVTGSEVFAQDALGKNEFMAACVACHGESAKGDGPVGKMLNISVPDLTTLSSRNDGTFPFLKVFMTVDGRTQIRSHGSQMPIWGERFSEEVRDDFGPFGRELIVRGRILSLINYLNSIQE